MKNPRINDDLLTNPPPKIHTRKKLERTQHRLAQSLMQLVLEGKGGSDEAQKLAYNLQPLLTILSDPPIRTHAETALLDELGFSTQDQEEDLDLEYLKDVHYDVWLPLADKYDEEI